MHVDQANLDICSIEKEKNAPPFALASYGRTVRHKALEAKRAFLPLIHLDRDHE